MAGISSTYQLNETVGFLHESGTAIVRLVEGSMVVVEDENGFERTVHAEHLVKIHVQSSDFEKHAFLEPKDHTRAKITVSVTIKTVPKKPMMPEIDLHIESLTESNSGMTNAEIIGLQLRALELFFNEMLASRMRKFIVIHGVGEGTLKSEVRTFIKSRKGAYCYDADFRKYGIGATEVEIRFTEREK